MNKLLMKIVILCAVSVIPVNAASVSILVIETGLANSSPDSIKSIMWENGLMDVLFESGHIVTNATLIRLPNMPSEGFPSVAESDLIDAKEGGMGFFVVAIISHPFPHDVILRLFNTETRQMLFEHTYTDRTYNTERMEYEGIKENIRTFVARIR